MDNLKQYPLEKMIELWQNGQVSFTEVVSYLLPKLLQLWRLHHQQADELARLRDTVTGLSLTLHSLKADVDSQHHQQHLDSPTKG